MRRGRAPSSPSPYRALAHHQQANSPAAMSDPSSLIRSFDVETNPTRPVRPSPLAASTIRDMPLDLVERIRSFPLFQSAPEDFLVAIGNHLKPQIHGPNDHIITEGDEAKAMYWLVRGVVAVTSRDGEAVYAELKSGAFFGEIGVLMNMPRTATIVARTKCLLLVLKKEDLQFVMPKFPSMEKAILEEAQERLNLLKKKRQEGGAILKSPKGDFAPRAAAPGEVSKGETGAIKDGAVVNHKKRKSPSPGIIEDPAAGSAIGSGFVNIRKTLKELPLFSTLPPDILHFLGLSVQPKTYPPFTDIIRQGNPGNDIYFIVQGEAEVIHEQPREPCKTQKAPGLIQSRPRLKSGLYFGEVASLGLSPGRTATVRSITTVECLTVPGDALDELWRRCPPDIKSQVEHTARMRYKSQDEDVHMADADADGKDTARSDPATPTPTPTPTTPSRGALPNLAYTTPSKAASPSKDDSEIMEPKDPDPFLSVNMENLRNRRRHSLAPPTPQTESLTPGRQNGMRSCLIDTTPIRFAIAQSPPDSSDARAKRAKTLPRRPISQAKPPLPDNILVRVFKELDVGELIRLRIVSRHWRDVLTTSPDVCNDVDLSHYNRRVSDEVIIRVLAPFIGTRAVTVDLNNCFHITDEGFSALWHSCGKKVKQWRMKSVWDVSANQILEMSENAKDLEEVDWSNCRKVGDNLLGRVVGWVVPGSPTTAKKSVVMPPSGTQPGQSNLSKVKKGAQKQEEPKQSAAPGTVFGCPKLKKLNLSYCKHITDRSMAHLAAHASNRLVSLSLTRCTSISDAGFQSWAAYKFEKLTDLCLADCTYLSDNAIVALVNAAKNLTHLDLSFCCALSDTSTEVVALGLPRLRELRLAFCGSAVSDGSLESIALHLTELEGLSVRGCVRVTGKGMESVLRGCTRLKWTDVSQCRNLEGWLRTGSLAKWGFDDRTARPMLPARMSAAMLHGGIGGIPVPKAMSVAMLTTPSYLPRASLGFLGRRARQPVRFIVEKGVQGLSSWPVASGMTLPLQHIIITTSPARFFPLFPHNRIHTTRNNSAYGLDMSFTLSIRQGPARLAQRLPELTKSAFRAPVRSFHQPAKPSAGFFTSRITTSARNAFSRAGSARAYSQEAAAQQTAAGGSGMRRLLVGGAIFGGTLVAINAVFNRETRDDGGMPLYERDYLNNTFLHTGPGVGIIGLTARQMVQTGFVYRLMVTNPWVVGIGGLALSFATMIGTRSISPDNYVPKYALWTAFNATQAAFVAPLLAFVPGPLLARAGLYTIAMMGALSVVGATAKQEKYLYIGGPLLAGAAIVAVSGFAPLIIPATAVRTLAFTESIWLYGGLAVFGGFTLYDVQKVLHHARLAQAGVMRRDPVNESISLELDFLNIFVRMVQLLSNQRRK
ncbi:Growth hormone-inducible transmembrane protein [Tolypocladium ophioglossoides CBS 100239]|uniref:Growth hormone-inducible transmembrane protein n=1 Tax=Tolypocladium ophioglossoides (strain CBS 100239) TaxID=1163406 RepID=A0A0L0NAU3_TOLOC|nr:Growth hormone-inducible transmembrane protein [Tolypocladium ophioglossoides CBS 100239]